MIDTRILLQVPQQRDPSLIARNARLFPIAAFFSLNNLEHLQVPGKSKIAEGWFISNQESSFALCIPTLQFIE